MPDLRRHGRNRSWRRRVAPGFSHVLPSLSLAWGATSISTPVLASLILRSSPYLASFYGILANVCFTGGWVAELIVQRKWPEEANRFATTSFSLGLILSVLLTLTPAILVGVAGIFKLVSHFLGMVHQ